MGPPTCPSGFKLGEAPSLNGELAALRFELNLARRKRDQAFAQFGNRGLQLFEGIRARVRFRAHPMGLKECPGPERLHDLEHPGGQGIESRPGPRLKLRGKRQPPALERRGDRIGTRPAHPLAHVGDGGSFALAQERKRRRLEARRERLRSDIKWGGGRAGQRGHGRCSLPESSR